MVQQTPPLKMLKSRGKRVIKEEGVISFGQKGVRYLTNYATKTAIPRIKDKYVRKFLNDQHTLPSHLRRYQDYNQTRAMAVRTYREISAHTGIPLKENAYDSMESRPSLDGFRIGDIGCGDGNLAVQFIENHPEAEYIGMDIQKNRIDALNKRFDSENYQFEHVDVYNGRYNPSGDLSPESFDFPFPDDHFDLITLRSVFTHMLPGEIENYLSEIDRVLADDGVVWTTWFLILDESDKDPEGKLLEFTAEHDGYYSLNQENPERGVAYPVQMVEEFIDGKDLEIENQIPGWWRDETLFTTAGTDVQDVLVFK